MIDISKGRYWDKAWSLVDGCTPCSPGCYRCWSASMAHRFGEFTIKCDDNPPQFMGVVTPRTDRLSIPLRTRKPTVFSIWNDWCHEDVDHVFRHKMVIRAEFSEHHVFLALTKRPHIMLDFWKSGIQHVPANWWTGLTVCNQAEADAKIPVFLQVPGKKFLSIEPMLGPVNLRSIIFTDIRNVDALRGDIYQYGKFVRVGGKIDAVILGGETGAGARPLHPDWVRSVRDQCAAAGVPFFFKSWGEWAPIGSAKQGIRLTIDGRDGRYLENCFEGDNQTWLHKVGRKVAGRLLDGRTHDDLPWVVNETGNK